MSGTCAISTTSRRELSSSFFFLQGKAPKQIYDILTETLVVSFLVWLRTCQHSCVTYHFFSNLVAVCFVLTSCVPLLTPWCRVCTGLQLVKKFPVFHGTRRFITALTSVRHLSLSRASPIQSIYPHPTSRRSILILSTHLRLGLPSGLLPSGFPTKTLHTSLSSPIRATCPAHLILLDIITRT